jgi:hypothetical protein
MSRVMQYIENLALALNQTECSLAETPVSTAKFDREKFRQAHRCGASFREDFAVLASPVLT